MRRDVFVSVVVPLAEDGDIVEGFVADLDAVMRQSFGDYELIFVDDGSTDGTRSVFERIRTRIPCLRYFRLTRPFGREMAIACGLEQAIGDVIVTLSPACDPPRHIPEFVEKALATSGIVFGVAAEKSKRSLAYRTAYHLYFGLCRLLLPRSQVENATHFIALSRTALNALLKIKDSARHIRVLAMYAGFEATKIPYAFVERRTPRRRRRLGPLLAGAVQMIVANSDRPLRVAAIVCAAIGVLDFLYILYVLAMRLFLPGVQPGWATTNIFAAVMFGVQFLVFAVICEYLAQIRAEQKRRPLYVVQDELQSNVMLASGEERNIVAHEERSEPVLSPPETVAESASDRQSARA